MNQFNNLHGDEATDTLREWTIKPLAAHLKSRTSPTKTNPVFSAITGILNHNSIDNGDVEVHPSEFPVESNPESVLYTDTTTTK